MDRTSLFQGNWTFSEVLSSHRCITFYFRSCDPGLSSANKLENNKNRYTSHSSTINKNYEIVTLSTKFGVHFQYWEFKVNVVRWSWLGNINDYTNILTGIHFASFICRDGYGVNYPLDWLNKNNDTKNTNSVFLKNRWKNIDDYNQGYVKGEELCLFWLSWMAVLLWKIKIAISKTKILSF